MKEQRNSTSRAEGKPSPGCRKAVAERHFRLVSTRCPSARCCISAMRPSETASWQGTTGEHDLSSPPTNKSLTALAQPSGSEACRKGATCYFQNNFLSTDSHPLSLQSSNFQHSCKPAATTFLLSVKEHFQHEVQR